MQSRVEGEVQEVQTWILLMRALMNPEPDPQQREHSPGTIAYYLQRTSVAPKVRLHALYVPNAVRLFFKNYIRRRCIPTLLVVSMQVTTAYSS